MAHQRLKTVNDARVSFDDEKPEVVRNFFGEELVDSPAAMAGLESHTSPETEADLFLQANEDRFKLHNITLHVSDVLKGKAITSVQYQQTHKEYPVYNATLTIALRNRDRRVVSTVNNVDYAIPADIPGETTKIDEVEILRLIGEYFKDLVRSYKVKVTRLFLYRHVVREHVPPPRGRSADFNRIVKLANGQEGKLYLVWQVKTDTKDPSGNWELLIDATTGEVVSVSDRRRYFPKAYVFMPDPITSSCQALTWETEIDILDAQRVVVELEDLDQAGPDGKWSLKGKWVNCVDVEPATVPTPTSDSDGHFMFGSKQDEFLFAMGYYWTTRLIKYLRELGNEAVTNAINAPLVIDVLARRINGASGDLAKTDNSRIDVDVNDTPSILFGDGGVPDASDAHVIVHEYGHVLHHLLKRDYGCYEEGFCDFLAGAWLDRFNTKRFQREKVFPWDNNASINWGPKRRLDLKEKFDHKHFKYHSTHIKGNIWATGLWCLFLSMVGKDGAEESEKAADTLIQMYLEVLLMVEHLTLRPEEKPEVLGLALLEADKQLHGFPGQYRQQIWDAFKDRGLWTGDPPPLEPS